MKSSRNSLLVVVFIVVTGIVVYAARHGQSSKQYESADDFLKDVRKESVTKSGNETGFIPGTDQKFAIPEIDLGTDTLDLGLVSNKDITLHDFPIHNKGQADLVIGNVSTECHCTEGGMAEGQKVIKPGGTGILKIGLYPERVPGGFASHKVLTISSNDPKHPMVQLTVLSKIDPEFSVVPDSLDFGELIKGKTATKTLRVRQIYDEPFAINSVDPQRPEDAGRFALSFEKLPEKDWAKPGHVEYTVTVTLTSQQSVGEFSSGVMVKNTCTRQNVKDFWVPVKAVIKSFYSLSAPKLMIGAADVVPGKEFAGSVAVIGEREFQISNLTVTDTAMTVTSMPGNRPNTTVIAVGVSPAATPGVKNGEIHFTIASQGETYTESIPVQVIVPGKV